MNAKQQYKEAYRVARIMKISFPTLKEQIDFIKTFKWNFSGDTYHAAYTSLQVR